MFPTGAVLAAGHRLRVTVQSFDTPYLSPTTTQVVYGAGGLITIHHSPAFPSRVVLPVRAE